MIGHLIKYSDFYSTSLSRDPVDLIHDIPKQELIATIAAINSKIKPPSSNHFDDSRETQIECLRILFLDNNNPIQQSLCLPIIQRYVQCPPNHNLFSRVTCLYALQEIINNDDFVTETPEYNFDNRERIFKFLLIANEQILQGDQNYKCEGYEQLGHDFFEFFMFRELYHNQYYHCSNAINISYKSFYLFEKIENSHRFGKHFINYLTWHYKVENTSELLKHVIWTYIKSFDEELSLRYINVSKENTEVIKILDSFSDKVEYTIPDKSDLKKFDFFPLKKSPLYKSTRDRDKEFARYFPLDDGFYIEKIYSIFFNDFWYDYLKPNEICTREDWGNFIGSEFFEPFIGEILKASFINSADVVLRTSNELKFKMEGKTEIEYADYYVRKNQNVALFEVKSGYIPLDHGYKTVSSIDDYKNLDLDKFNKDYGLEQLAEKTIKKFHFYKNEINDPYFNLSRKVQIYPIIIVNDPILSSSIVTFVMKRKFNELLEKYGIKKKAKEHNIKDLCIINVSHLQEIEQGLNDKKLVFFELLDLYLSMSNYQNRSNHINYKFLRTFDHVINRKVKNNLIADRIKALDWLDL